MILKRHAKTRLSILAAVVVGYAIVSLAITSSYYQLVLTQIVLWTIMGVAWNMLSGYSGLFSFGHAAFWGLGAYTVAVGFVFFGITPWLGIPLGGLVGVAAAAVIGLLTFRLTGHYFALAMLAYPLSLLYVFEWLGLQEVSLPMMRENPAAYMQFSEPRLYTALALGVLAAALLVSLRIESSRFGMALVAIKQNERAAEAAGIDTLRWKLRAMMLSGGFAAVAGGLYAILLLIVTPPSVFGMHVSSLALIVTLFGGIGSLWGPVIGAAVLVLLAEVLQGELGDRLPGIQGVVYGLAIIGTILFARSGVYWWIRDRRRVAAPSEAAAAPAPAAPVATPASTARGGRLVLENVGIAFGGLKALQGVAVAIEPGTVHAIIGPNGAGKTTLFNVINGFLKPNAGHIAFDGGPVTGLRPDRICAHGIGRTFQVMRPFARLTVLENVLVGAFVGADDDAAAERDARAALARVGLSGRVDAVAGSLTTKELRLMELARALAPRPRLVLLDETLAGLAQSELDEVLDVIRQLRAEGVTVAIIEHTMHALLKVADTMTVLDHGQVIASGAPEVVLKNPAVIEAYLGKRWAQRAAH